MGISCIESPLDLPLRSHWDQAYFQKFSRPDKQLGSLCVCGGNCLSRSATANGSDPSYAEDDSEPTIFTLCPRLCPFHPLIAVARWNTTPARRHCLGLLLGSSTAMCMIGAIVLGFLCAPNRPCRKSKCSFKLGNT
jgi:hypothetical protein